MKRTILISTLANGLTSQPNTIEEKVAVMFGEVNSDLSQCYDILPGMSGPFYGLYLGWIFREWATSELDLKVIGENNCSGKAIRWQLKFGYELSMLRYYYVIYSKSFISQGIPGNLG